MAGGNHPALAAHDGPEGLGFGNDCRGEEDGGDDDERQQTGQRSHTGLLAMFSVKEVSVFARRLSTRRHPRFLYSLFETITYKRGQRKLFIAAILCPKNPLNPVAMLLRWRKDAALF